MGEQTELIKPVTEEYMAGMMVRKLCKTGQWKKLCRELELYDVIKIVYRVTGVTLADLRKHNRARKFVDARHLVVLLANDHTKHSQSAVGRCINRDHTTVLSLLKRERTDAFEETYNRAEKAVDRFKESVFGPPYDVL